VYIAFCCVVWDTKFTVFFCFYSVTVFSAAGLHRSSPNDADIPDRSSESLRGDIPREGKIVALKGLNMSSGRLFGVKTANKSRVEGKLCFLAFRIIRS